MWHLLLNIVKVTRGECFPTVSVRQMEWRDKMGTMIRPELSKKNRYWISRNRFYELKHFCLQYPEWKKEYQELLMSFEATSHAIEKIGESSNASDPTKDLAIMLYDKGERIKMIEETANETNAYLAPYILLAVTKGQSYEYLSTILNMSCGKSYYFEYYRKFFYLLSKKR